RRDALEAILGDDVAATGYAFQIETTFRVAERGFDVVEIPIAFGERGAGASKMGPGIALEALWRVPALRLQSIRWRFWTRERAAAYPRIALWWAASRALVLLVALGVQVVRWPRRAWYPDVFAHPFALLG